MQLDFLMIGWTTLPSTMCNFWSIMTRAGPFPINKIPAKNLTPSQHWPTKSVMWTILASLIGQFQHWLKFYAGIYFYSIGARIFQQIFYAHRMDWNPSTTWPKGLILPLFPGTKRPLWFRGEFPQPDEDQEHLRHRRLRRVVLHRRILSDGLHVQEQLSRQLLSCESAFAALLIRTKVSDWLTRGETEADPFNKKRSGIAKPGRKS